MDRLLRRVLAQEPDASIVLVGHSMGGMVATYYLSQALSAGVSGNVVAVVTIDSPLRGTLWRSPFSACSGNDMAWRDIRGDTHVVGSIDTLRKSPLLPSLFAINSTSVGDKIPGSRVWVAPCGLLLFGGHDCALSYDPALSKISAIANGEEVTGFIRVAAQIDNLEGIPRSAISGSQDTVSFAITNTGDTTWTFGAMFSTKRPGTGVVDVPLKAITIAPADTRVVSIPTTWGEPGPRDIRITVWEQSSDPVHTLLADSGWLPNYMIVDP